MRELKKSELQEVSGGTFGLLGGLIGGLFGWGRSYCAPVVQTPVCNPAPVCSPAPASCAPRRRWF